MGTVTFNLEGMFKGTHASREKNSGGLIICQTDSNLLHSIMSKIELVRGKWKAIHFSPRSRQVLVVLVPVWTLLWDWQRLKLEVLLDCVV